MKIIMTFSFFIFLYLFNISLFYFPFQWVNTVVMGWLNHVYNGTAAVSDAENQTSIKKFQQKISHFLYKTYTRTRIEQLFNIIIGKYVCFNTHHDINDIFSAGSNFALFTL